MRSLQNWIKGGIALVALAVGLLGVGFWLGANFLAPSFLETKLHEWLGSIGTAGALLVMAYGQIRDRRWRIYDAKSKTLHAWAAISSDVHRLAAQLEMVKRKLETANQGCEGLNKELLMNDVGQARKTFALLRSHGDVMTRLPVFVAQHLRSCIAGEERWAQTVEDLTNINSLPGSVGWDATYHWASFTTESLVSKLAYCQDMWGTSDIEFFS